MPTPSPRLSSSAFAFALAFASKAATGLALSSILVGCGDRPSTDDGLAGTDDDATDSFVASAEGGETNAGDASGEAGEGSGESGPEPLPTCELGGFEGEWRPVPNGGLPRDEVLRFASEFTTPVLWGHEVGETRWFLHGDLDCDYALTCAAERDGDALVALHRRPDAAEGCPEGVYRLEALSSERIQVEFFTDLEALEPDTRGEFERPRD